MAFLQNIYDRMSKELGETSPIIKDLKRWVHSMDHAREIVAGRFMGSPGNCDRALRIEVRRLRRETQQLKESLESERDIFEETIAAAEQKYPITRPTSLLKIVQQDEPSLGFETLCEVVQADLHYPGIVDRLRECPLIANEVNQPRAKLLLVRQHMGAVPDDQYWLDLTLHTECACSLGADFVICDEGDLGALLSNYDLFLFGCGSGYVTDECLLLSPYVRSNMSLTTAVARVLIEDIERMSKEKWIRVEEDGYRVWRRPEHD